MNTTVNKVKENISDLQMALYLECTREEAKKIGTDKYWKSIHRKIKRIERKAKKFEKAINKEAGGTTVWENIAYYIVMSLPFIYLLFSAGVIATAVFLLIKLFC